jgi:hypothetical protein
MSWSVGAIGKASAVATEIAKQFTNGSKCAEPEESIRQAAASLIATSLGAQTDPSKAVKVQASGSQSEDYTTKLVSNSLSISIEPVYGFVE